MHFSKSLLPQLSEQKYLLEVGGKDEEERVFWIGIGCGQLKPFVLAFFERHNPCV